jgi:hypothetical protein
MACFLDVEAMDSDDLFGSSVGKGSVGSLESFIVGDSDVETSSYADSDDAESVGSQCKRRSTRSSTINYKRARSSVQVGNGSEGDEGEDEEEVARTGDEESSVHGGSEHVTSLTGKKRGRGRPRGPACVKGIAAAAAGSAAAAPSPRMEDEIPGSERFPVTNYSVTITKPSSDVGPTSLDIVDVFMKKYCLQGGAATEVGKRAHRFHLQCLMRLKYPRTDIYKKKLQTFIKALLPGRGVGYKVFAKPLAAAQSFKAMIGYILKDEGEPYFQVRFHNIKRYFLYRNFTFVASVTFHLSLYVGAKSRLVDSSTWG